MRFQVIFLIAAISIWASQALGNDQCFGFNKPITKPLFDPSTKGESASGTNPDDSDTTWAWVRGTVNKPISQVLALLLDHNTTKSPKTEVEVEQIPAPDYLARHRVKFTIRPFPLLLVHWIEQWGYALTGGTREKPSNIVISYEKTEGTHHIRKLCGSIVLKKADDKNTDFYQYEQAKATQRSVADTLSGIKGTLATLRK